MFPSHKNEWLITNGLGGYASSTIAGINTRRYHSLLCASLTPPTERVVTVGHLGEALEVCVSNIQSVPLNKGELKGGSFNNEPSVSPFPRETKRQRKSTTLNLSEKHTISRPHYLNDRSFEPEYLRNFTRFPLPTWQYGNENFSLEKTLTMIEGKNTTLIRYRNTGESVFKLKLTPLVALRDYHDLMNQESGIMNHEIKKNTLKTFHTDNPEFFVKIKYHKPKNQKPYNLLPNTSYLPKNWTFHNLYYATEESRGFDATEKAYCPAELETYLPPGEEFFVIISTEKRLPSAQQIEAEFRNKEKGTRNKANEKQTKNIPRTSHLVSLTSFKRDLTQSALQFVTHRQSTNGKTILAGYPWFTDWGRDTLISLREFMHLIPEKDTESLIETFLAHTKDGLLPNRFPDNPNDDVEYNTIDATLWLFVVIWEYYATRKTDQKVKREKLKENSGRRYKFIKKILPSLTNILEHHFAGTHYNIRVLDNGFLFGGQEGVQLTWMDAKIGDHVVTPRIGCPVEINALWYNALKIYDAFTSFLFLKKNNLCHSQLDWESGAWETTYDKYSSSRPPIKLEVTFLEKIKTCIIKIEQNFYSEFWNESAQCLYDVVIPGEKYDARIRPNQLYVLSLPFLIPSPFPKGGRQGDSKNKNHSSSLTLNQTLHKTLFTTLTSHLYTPYGLRSLSQDDLSFCPAYIGNPWQRDTAYHQGTVWPFLLMDYWIAHQRIYGQRQTKLKLKKDIKPLMRHFYEDGCIGGVSEVFDGLEPKHGKGCTNQAWSVAALLRMVRMLES